GAEPGEALRLAPLAPLPQALRPLPERRRVVAEGMLGLCSHDAQIDKGGGEVSDLRIWPIGGNHDGNFVFARQPDCVRATEALMAQLDGVTQVAPVLTAGEQMQEGFEFA